jgi:hypothetical protein
MAMHGAAAFWKVCGGEMVSSAWPAWQAWSGPTGLRISELSRDRVIKGESHSIPRVLSVPSDSPNFLHFVGLDRGRHCRGAWLG